MSTKPATVLLLAPSQGVKAAQMTPNAIVHDSWQDILEVYTMIACTICADAIPSNRTKFLREYVANNQDVLQSELYKWVVSGDAATQEQVRTWFIHYAFEIYRTSRLWFANTYWRGLTYDDVKWLFNEERRVKLGTWMDLNTKIFPPNPYGVSSEGLTMKEYCNALRKYLVENESDLLVFNGDEPDWVTEGLKNTKAA